MAGEMQCQFSIVIGPSPVNPNLQYSSKPTSFKVSPVNFRGPSPGLIKQVPTAGVDVNLSQLTQPGVAWIQNLDANNKVVVGIFDPAINKFIPFLDVLPGEFWPIRLSQYIFEDFNATGTSIGDTNLTLRIKSINNPCDVRVDCFDT
jgi:hypothetical protein